MLLFGKKEREPGAQAHPRVCNELKATRTTWELVSKYKFKLLILKQETYVINTCMPREQKCSISENNAIVMKSNRCDIFLAYAVSSRADCMQSSNTTEGQQWSCITNTTIFRITGSGSRAKQVLWAMALSLSLPQDLFRSPQ